MMNYFLNPAQKLFTAGTLLKKNIVSRLNAVNRYTILPVEKKFEQLLRLVKGSPCILLDLDGTILSWNKTFEKLIGYSSPEIVGQNFSIFYLPRERQEHLPEELLKEATTKGKACRCGKHVKKDGGTFLGTIQLGTIKNSSGEVIGFTETTIVIPEQEND